MKKIYIITLMIIMSISTIFLFFYADENTVNKRFLSSFGIVIDDNPLLVEDIIIPDTFDEHYDSYNIIQIESGLTLLPYKGKKAVRYSYKVLNFPDSECHTVFANVITVNSKPVAGDINCPSLDGFLLPLSYFDSIK